MDIAVVDVEKAIREHICALIEEQRPESRIEAYAAGGELLASASRRLFRFRRAMKGIEMDIAEPGDAPDLE